MLGVSSDVTLVLDDKSQALDKRFLTIKHFLNAFMFQERFPGRVECGGERVRQ